MYVNKRQVMAYRGIATLVSLALLGLALGVHMFTSTALAANVTSFSDTLTDSNPGSVSDHTIAFTIPNGMTIGQNFTITFDALFDTSSIVIGDIDLLLVGTGDQTIASGASGAGQWGVTGLGTDSITFTTPTDSGLASSSQLVVDIGRSGANAVGTENQIVNPTATSSYEIVVTGTMQDGGTTQVAIIENVLVTARVATIFEFTVNGVADGTAVNGSATTTSTTTTNTTLPFETLFDGVSKTLAQDLTVRTNAANGYVVTVYQDQQIQSSTGAIIDDFADNSYVTVPQSWVSPTGNFADNTTWGHWGLTSTDFITGRASEFSADTWVSASTSPIIVMGHASSSDGVTAGIGAATVGYQIEITALQEAGDDYQTTLTYIATPTF